MSKTSDPQPPSAPNPQPPSAPNPLPAGNPKPPVAQVLIEMALACGQGIGPDVVFTTKAGEFFHEHYRQSVAAAIAIPNSDWNTSRTNVLRVAVIMGKTLRKLAQKNNNVFDEKMADTAANEASSNQICPQAGGRHCP